VYSFESEEECHTLREEKARIDDVVTLPAFQGKGYATHLMRHVLSQAKKLGARYCFLESSDSGFRIYQKLGFEPLYKNNFWLDSI
jgi:ribosomal protein S18 acetylase RimI-like enzyme